MEEPSSQDAAEEPLRSLARELRQTVGAELRAESEIVEHDTETGRRRRRTASEVLREAAARGDRVSLMTGARTITGEIAQVGRDYLTVATQAEIVDARIAGVVVAVHPRARGGSRPTAAAVTFTARISEYEQTGERVTLVTASGDQVSGVVEIVADDHILVVDADDLTNLVPLERILLVLRPGPRRES